MKKGTIIVALLAILSHTFAQVPTVPKTYTKPVLMHYMPWYQTPEIDGYWGWHWTMNHNDPNTVVDTATGERDIASFFNPIIGPYSSKDPHVIEYHLLLMKYAGIDGVLIDWYGKEGSNGDVGVLLQASDAMVAQTDDVGLSVAIVLEDRFSDTISNVMANFAYMRDNYFNQDNYFRWGEGNDPLVALYGPLNHIGQEAWDDILPYAGEEVELMAHWHFRDRVGDHEDGTYIWVKETHENGVELDNHYELQHEGYTTLGPTYDPFMAALYPGFDDYYEVAGVEEGYFTIEHEEGAVLDSMMSLLDYYDEYVDMVQLITWNDYGEGTMFEPTLEFGYTFLTELQTFLGVEYGEHELEQIHRLYELRKERKGDFGAQAHLDEAAEAFINVDPELAESILDQVDTLYGGTLLDYFYIVSRDSGKYLCQKNDELSYADSSVGNACLWHFEYEASGYSIKNAETTDYVHIENQKPYVQVGTASPAWTSAKWNIVEDDEGFYSMASKWLGGRYIHVKNYAGYAQAGKINPSEHTAQYNFILANEDFNVGVSELEQPLVEIYPQPASNWVRVQAEESIAEWRMVDINGKQVLSGGVIQGPLDISTLASGTYFLELTLQSGNMSSQQLSVR